MRREVPTVRIVPMSDKADGFVGRDIPWVQQEVFLRELQANGGLYHYQSTGLNAPPGSVLLFQYKARVIASGVFLRNERFEQPIDGYGGVLHLDVDSIRTFAPVDLTAMRRAWPGMRAFGHVKQYLNPAGYPAFKRRLTNVTAPHR
ncbi:MAG TPA: hypothetical protein VGN72_14065 [Tepidisphaeraceae bacterium]|jgi:hypothetical protein|nr:hypothetical protein [Tepidisphaeraceae bacterium]